MREGYGTPIPVILSRSDSRLYFRSFEDTSLTPIVALWLHHDLTVPLGLDSSGISEYILNTNNIRVFINLVCMVLI